MRAIRLQNVRSLGDTGRVEIKPITLLLGQNSSGKSTFLRSLPLLEQSVRTRSNVPVLWYGDLVDFGSITDVRSTFAGDESVHLEIDLGPVSIDRRRLMVEGRPASGPEMAIDIELTEVDGRTRLKSFTVYADKDVLRVKLDAKGATTELTVNGLDFTRLFPGDRFRFSRAGLVPQLIRGSTPDPRPDYYFSPYGYRRGLETVDREVRKFFSDRLPRRVSDERISLILRRLPYASSAPFKKRLREASSLKSWADFTEKITAKEGRRDLLRLRSLLMLAYLTEILTALDGSMTKAVSSISYVGPSRATGERYYRMQELAVDQIDPQGRNVAMFLHSLPTIQFRQFSEWLLEAIGYAIQIERSTGHIQIHLREESSQIFHNLADMGYGFSQVLPIMAQVWSRQTRSITHRHSNFIVAMEQPELHLHPAYQARLAGVFCRAISKQRRSSRPQSELQFVIETHSEALINQLGNLVYEGVLPADDIAIYVFERNDDDERTELRAVNFEKDGTLSNWPIGFFSTSSK